LKKELAALRQMHDAGTFDSALSLLRQHLAHPSGIFDPHAALAALEQLVDAAREVAIAKEIQKALRRSLPPYPPREERPRFNLYPRRQPPVCFACGRCGHFATSCNSRPRGISSYRKQN